MIYFLLLFIPSPSLLHRLHCTTLYTVYQFYVQRALLVFAYCRTHAALSEASMACSCCAIDSTLFCWRFNLTTCVDSSCSAVSQNELIFLSPFFRRLIVSISLFQLNLLHPIKQVTAETSERPND